MMDRPRRSTRNSLYNNSSFASSSSTPVSALTNSVTPSSASTSSNNPYKKPTYLANRPPPPQLLEIGTSTSTVTPKGRGGRGRGRPSSAKNGSSATTSGGVTTPVGSGSLSGNGRGRPVSRPECVATRVESRRSTGGSSASNKKKKRGAYNSQDYHYGSDFSDQNDSETEHLDERGSGSESISELGNEGADSDSDFSITSSTPKLPPSRVPSPPVPLWMDIDNVVEELELPKSSDDLLLDRDLVMKAVAIYEPLRRFHQLVRLSPFRFEDFCAALANEETSSLLTEIHIQLLKTILREEEVNSTMFGPVEVKDSIQAVLFFIDNLTWPECLRAYIESDPNWADVHKAISSVEYPLGGAEIRIKVLSWMVDQFLATSLVRDVLVSETIVHDDNCRSCSKVGEVVMCETCPAVYHLYCISPPYKNEELPGDWQCPVCVKNSVPGISDCASELEKAGLLIRHEKLGNDRHGRKYWFLVRRILVESEDGSSVWYYSTPLQVEELLYRLDEDGYEAKLVENIRNCEDEIVRQMEVTEAITEEANTHRRKTYIDAENVFLKKIHEDRELAHVHEIENQSKEAERALEAKRIEEEKKALVEDEVKQREELEKKRIREERLLRRNQNKFVDYNPADWVDDGLSKSSPGSDAGGLKVNHCDEMEKIEEIKQESISESEKPQSIEEMTASQIANADTQVIDSQEAPEAKSSEAKEDQEPEVLEIKEEKMEMETLEISSIKKYDYDDLFVKVEKNVAPKPGEESVLPNVNRRKSKALLLDWDTEERMTRLKATGLYKLGQEGNFRSYVNVYNADGLALSKFQHGEESNKKRHMSHKFSLTAASEVKWNSFTNSVGLRSNVVSCLRATMVHLEGVVPATLMHINWHLLRKAWVAAVSNCVCPKDFSKAMIALAACLRPSVFNPIWFEALGHHKMIRTSAVEREERKKAEKRDKKDREDEEDRLRLLPQFVKYSIPTKHQVYKQKGEEYRIHGRWGWIWMSSLRKCKPQDCRKTGLLAGPHKHVIQVKNDTGKVKTILIDPNTFDKLMAKRSLSQRSTPSASTLKVPTASTPSTKLESASADPPTKSENDSFDPAKSEKPWDSSTPAEEKMEVDESGPVSTAGDKVVEDICKEVKSGEEDQVTAKEEPQVASTIVTPMEVVGAEPEQQSQPQAEDPKSLNDDIESKVVPEAGPVPVEEKIKCEVKEEKDTVSVQPSPHPSSASSSNDDVRGAISGEGRKFRTELINVSLGIVSANRILYPKIAHKTPILDNLLSRRIQLQKLEEQELLETYGKEKLEKVQKIVDNGGYILDETVKEEDKDNSGAEVLEDNFPLAGIYRRVCYSYMCQSAAIAFSAQNTTKVREYEYKCYSPMCRLKFFVQDSNRRKEEKLKLAERAKLAQLVEEVVSKKMFTQTESTSKILLKMLPDERKRRNQVKYPLTSTFKSASSKDPSIFVLPHHELKKLSRTAGRTFTPAGFAPAPKSGTWAWPYPCGRPLFKSVWQFKAVHANTLAAAALQLRILWASVKWDDMQAKPPNNYDGKHHIQTDMENITTEILQHRVVGRFLERVQYLRKKTVEPIDAPKQIREVTPSRSGLRKRKLAESLTGIDPVVTEDWVDEDRVELWEMKLYHEKLERKNDPNSKPGTPSTRTKSGVALKQPEKYDPSPTEKDKVDKEKPDKNLSPAKTAELMREQMETELKMQRAVHLSKRDNHPKNNNTVNKIPTPTASQQLQQQQAAAGLPANPRSYGAGPSVVKKVTVVSTKLPTVDGTDGTSPSAAAAPGSVGILNRKPNTVAIPKIGPAQQPAQQRPLNSSVQQKLTVYRTPDGQLQVRGLLPGQSVYQTLDGKLGLSGTPIRSLLPPPQQQQHIISPQSQGQTILIKSQGPGQLQQVTASGVIQLQSSVATQPSTPLINITSPAMRTVLASSSSSGGTIKLIPHQQSVVQSSIASPNLSVNQTALIHTYSAASNKNVRKVNPKLPGTPTAIAPANSGTSAGQQLTGTLNAQGQIVLTRGAQVIQGINQQGQIVLASHGHNSTQGTIVVSSGGNLLGLTPVKNPPITVQSGGGNVSLAQSSASGNTTSTTTFQISGQPSQTGQTQILQGPGPGVAVATHQPGGRVVIQDGNKTIVVSGGANLTPQQLQQILQLQLKKPGPLTPGKQIIQQTAGGTSGPQQIQIQPSPQAGTMQIIQHVGGSSAGPPQQVQIISGAQNLQQLPSGQGQIVLQGLPSGHIQNVIVKKIMKSPMKSGGGTPVTIAPGTPTAAQIHALFASNKNLVRVDPKTGVMNISSATLQQLQQQQQLALSSPTSNPGVGSTTVTKSPGLPISIVSPSKNPKIVPTLFPQVSQLVPQTGTAAVKTIPSIVTPLVTPSTRPIAPAIIQQQQQKTLPSPQIVTTPIVSKQPSGIGVTEVQQSLSTIPSPAVVASTPKMPYTPQPAPSKVAAQFIETANGPRVLVTGFKPGDLSPSQLSNLTAQIFKQLQEHPALRDKFLALGDDFSESKIILQQHPLSSAVMPTEIERSGPSPPKIAKVEPPVKPASPVKAQSPLSSPTKVLTSPTTHLGAKSPPNSANIDAAIAAVASDVDAPVILPAPKSPRKTVHSATAFSSSPTKKEDILKNILAKPEVENKLSPLPKFPKKKSPKKTPVPAVTALTPVEPSSVPQPVEQDVVIAADDVANEVEVSENKGEVPRFVLSQDLIAGHKQTETASSMTFFADGRSPQQQPQNDLVGNTGTAVTKSGSSRRKSPVKVKQMHNTDLPPISSPPKKRISMSPMASQKQIAILNKQKELLRRDMSKKRVLLERDLRMDINKEISQDDVEEKGLSSDVEVPEQSHPKVIPKKRKSSETKTSQGGGSHKRKRNSSDGKRATPTPSKKQKSRGQDRLFCICQTPYDNSKFYIECDICSDWFHGDCVGIEEVNGKNISEFICSSCKPTDNAHDSSAMCLCRQPYVETQFCIACEKCDEWFHGRCVGILPTEGDSIPQYYCPTCQPNLKVNAVNAKELMDDHYVEISKTLRQIQNHKSAWPFMDPVDVAEAPNYYKVIKEPLDLKTIALRVEQKAYTQLLDFVADLAKIIDNYRFFNPPESQIHKAGNVLEKFCSQKMKHLRDVLGKK